MSKKIKRSQDDSETLYRLLRQAIRTAEAVAEPEYPMTTYLLRVAFVALEDEMRAAIEAEIRELTIS